jgi:hypothetical protein
VERPLSLAKFPLEEWDNKMLALLAGEGKPKEDHSCDELEKL